MGRFTCKIALAGLLGSFLASDAAGQAVTAGSSPGGLPRNISATFTEDPIVIDGALDERAWSAAIPAADFIQSEPHQGQPATERTEVRVLYDRDYLYFGVYCYDAEPGRITINDLGRNFNLSDNDIFLVTVDTFGDGRNGFYFATNAGGAKAEGQFFNQGAEVNRHWEGVWHVRTRVRPDGWVAEIAIPLKTLRFAAAQAQVWGINFERGIKRKHEISTWSPLPRRYNSMHMALAGRLLGLDGIEPGRNLKLKPFSVLDLRQSAPGLGPLGTDVGADLKYGLTPGLTLDLTVNTDFSHVEVDDEQVNLTRFSLFFPEKRDFFLENAGIFRFGMAARESPGRGAGRESRDLMLFFSRRIGLVDGQPVPLLGGARLTGKAGDYRVGLLNVQTRDAPEAAGRNFLAARVRRELFSASDVGVMFLNQSGGSDGRYNRAMGVDANFRLWQNLTLSQFVARADSPDVSDGNWAYSFSSQWQDRIVNATLAYLDVQENFHNDMGFAPRIGIRHLEPGFGLTLRPPPNPWIREFYPHTRIRHITDQGNRVLSKYQHFDLTMRFHGGGQFSVARNAYFERLDVPFRMRPTVVLPVGDYAFDEVSMGLSSNTGKLVVGSIAYDTGSFWNGTTSGVTLGVTLTPSPRLGLNLRYSRDDVRLEQGAFTADVLRARVHYSFTTRMFLNAFVQYNGTSEQVISNVRFNFIHRPLSDIFVVYNETRDMFAGGRANKAVTLKYTHMLDF